MSPATFPLARRGFDKDRRWHLPMIAPPVHIVRRRGPKKKGRLCVYSRPLGHRKAQQLVGTSLSALRQLGTRHLGSLRTGELFSVNGCRHRNVVGPCFRERNFKIFSITLPRGRLWRGSYLPGVLLLDGEGPNLILSGNLGSVVGESQATGPRDGQRAPRRVINILRALVTGCKGEANEKGQHHGYSSQASKKRKGTVAVHDRSLNHLTDICGRSIHRKTGLLPQLPRRLVFGVPPEQCALCILPPTSAEHRVDRILEIIPVQG